MRLLRSPEYKKWAASLRDRKALARINARLLQIQSHGRLLGDVKPIGEGVYEIRFHSGPGYRVYVSPEGADLLLLLAGGDKSTQRHDLRRAIAIAKHWRKSHG